MDFWIWVLVVIYLLIGFVKTMGRIESGRGGASPIGTLIFGTLFWPLI
jgi:hypothetical protein